MAINQQTATAKLYLKIQNLPAPFDRLADFLVSEKAVMTGSFLFSCIMDVDFKANDIDLVFGPGFSGIEHLEKLGWSYVPKNRKTSSEGYLNRAHVFNEFHMAHPKCPGVFINYIQYQEGDSQAALQKCIDDNFDLDGCTLQWNGKEWHLADDVVLEDFFNKTLKYREVCLYERINPGREEKCKPNSAVCNKTPVETAVRECILERLHKYEMRGFKIVNADKIRDVIQRSR
jgi:hypothetical protein